MEDEQEDGDEKRLVLPGMKRSFLVDHPEVEDQTETASKDPISIEEKEEKPSQENSRELNTILSAAGRLARKNIPGTRPSSGDIHSIGDLVKGMTTTSKLMGKLSSIRGPNSQIEMAHDKVRN